MSDWICYLKTLFFKNDFKETIFDYFEQFLIKEDFVYLENFFNNPEIKNLVKDENLSYFNQFYLRYQRQKLIGYLFILKNNLSESKILFKKILYWESQFEILEKNRSFNLVKVIKKRQVLFKILCDYFKQVREKCNTIKLSFENDCQKLLNSNQTSDIPVETFDEILLSEEYSFVKLKSLFQLLKLIISELITLIIFVFFVTESDSIKVILNLIDFCASLINEFIVFNEKLKKEYFCLSLFLSDDDSLAKVDNLIDNENEKIVLSEMKIIRTKIFSSLFLVDQIVNNILDNKYSFDKEEKNFQLILNNFQTNLDILNSFLNRNIKKINVDTIKKLPNIDISVQKSEKFENVDEKEIEYQVFETYIDKQDKDIKNQSDYDINLGEKNYSAPLFYELKEALLVKAKDHKEREAKALGISVEILEKKLEKLDDLKTKKDKEESKLPISFNQINIAKQVALEKKKIKFLTDEENFGD